MYPPDVPVSYFGAAKPKANKINDLQCLYIICVHLLREIYQNISSSF